MGMTQKKQKDIKVWVGVEKEGDYWGVKTLFIGSYDITFNQIKSYATKHNVEQIYFGAGGCTPINFNVLEQTVMWFNRLFNKIVTVEGGIEHLQYVPLKLVPYLDFVITYNNKANTILQHLGENVQIKLWDGNKELYMGHFLSFEKVKTKFLDGKLYHGDKVLE